MAPATRNPLQNITLDVLRIVAALIFIQHGVQKLFGLLGGSQVEIFSLMGLAGVLELFGGLLLVLGLFTRPVAFILSGEMAFAYFMAHHPSSFWPVQNRGEMAALLSFIFLVFAVWGSGPLSLDALRRLRARRIAGKSGERGSIRATELV